MKISLIICQLTTFDGTYTYGSLLSSHIIGMWEITSIGDTSPAKITKLEKGKKDIMSTATRWEETVSERNSIRGDSIQIKQKSGGGYFFKNIYIYKTSM